MTSSIAQVGRNDPCHCGSGKKYKKCCLEADRAAKEEARTGTAAEAIPEGEIHGANELPGDAEFEQNNSMVEQGQTTEEDIEEHEARGGFAALTTDAPVRYYPRPPQIPDASPETTAIVDDWWDRFLPAVHENDLETMMSMIKTFLAEHPDKVPQLGLHEEILLDLPQWMIRAGRLDELIPLLQRFRNEHPTVYDQIFPFLDPVLVTHSVITGRTDEIPQLLDRFYAYPDNDPDFLDKLFHILLVSDRQEEVFTLARATAVPCSCSPHVVGYGPGLRWLLLETALPVWERREYSEEAAASMVEAYDALELPFDHGLDKAHAHQVLTRALGPLDWSLRNESAERTNFLHSLCLHFWIWLHDTQGFSWASSAFLADRLTSFLLNEDSDQENIDALLMPSEDAIDAFLVQECQNFFSFDGLIAFSQLQALWFMADYLAENHQIDSEQKQSLHNACLNLGKKLQKFLPPEDTGQLLFSDLEFGHLRGMLDSFVTCTKAEQK